MNRREREEVVNQLLSSACFWPAKKGRGKPGELLSAMKPEFRKQVEQLTADDFQQRGAAWVAAGR